MISAQNRYPNGFDVTNVYITSKEYNDYQGILEHPGLEMFWKFQNLIEMTGKLENIFNALDYPQPTHQARSLSEQDVRTNREAIDLKVDSIKLKQKPDKKPTFIVKVQYRQNASWQGTVQWVEQNKTQHFRSTLELIKLMDDAIGDDIEDVSWQEEDSMVP